MNEATATSIPRTPTLHYVVFVHLTALPSWLELSRRERQEVVEGDVNPILLAYPSVSVRWIDVEAFTADSSDVLLIETDDLREWNRMFEGLRDSRVFSIPYFRLDRILVGAEDGFRDYESSGVIGQDAVGTRAAAPTVAV